MTMTKASLVTYLGDCDQARSAVGFLYGHTLAPSNRSSADCSSSSDPDLSFFIDW